MVLLSLIPCLLLLPVSLAIKVTGATGGHNSTTGARPYRVDINDFAQSGPPFDLYIQALNQLQKTDQADPLSYFQIAGEQTRRGLSSIKLIRQAFTAIPRSHGMESMEQIHHIPDFVPTAPLLFRFGIVRT